MFVRLLVACIAISWLLGMESVAEPLRALILSGQNNHRWEVTTPLLRKALEDTARFKVTVTESPETLDVAALENVDVIVSNWNSFVEEGVKTWPGAAQDALLSFVAQGKGFVSVHAGSSSFYDWPEYQEMVMTYWDHGKTGHGRIHRFEVTCEHDHPITRGLPGFLIHDELWHQVPLPKEARVLATAFSSEESGGSGKNEPVLMVRDYGKGRSVNLLLGHDERAMQCPGFIRLFTRSVEWAATGDVGGREEGDGLIDQSGGQEADRETSRSQHESDGE